MKSLALRQGGVLRHTLCAVAVGLLALFAAPATSWAAAKTCLTGTDPSVAGDARQLATARALMLVFSCGSYCDGSPGKQTADFIKCAKKLVDGYVTSGYLRSQCKSTLLKQLKKTTCGTNPSQDAVGCVKKTTGGTVSCAIKPRAECVDQPGKFTQIACMVSANFPDYVLPYCMDFADTNYDGRIGTGDSGACAAPMCGNGVRESFEDCDPPGATCANGGMCNTCSCVAPTATLTSTPRPGQPTNTPPSGPPTNTPAPGQPTNTPAPAATRTPTPTPTVRFVDNGDGTITDNATGLTWEKKAGRGDPIHDYFAVYSWAVTLDFQTIWNFVSQLNTFSYAGHSDWRIPVWYELDYIRPSPCPGGGQPCVFPVFNNSCTPNCSATTCSCATDYPHWSLGPNSLAAVVPFDSNNEFYLYEQEYLPFSVRAVRGP